MVCPKCDAEYQPGLARCSDCLVDLIEPGAQPEVTSEEITAPAEAMAACVRRLAARLEEDA